MASNPPLPPQSPILTPIESPRGPDSPGLSEGQRLVDTFFAPSKTFTDLRRNASWWAPFLIMAIVSVSFVYVVDQKVGFAKAAENQMHAQPKQSERMERMPADQRQKVMGQQATVTKMISYSFTVIILLWSVIVAAVLLATLKFGASAEVKFKTLLALVMYSSLPGVLKSLLAIASILAGISADSFTLQNPVATNPGYFIDPASSPGLYALLSKLDIFTIWTLVLAAIGIPCIAKVKQSTSFMIVFGWFLFLILAGAGLTAAFS